MLRCKRKSCDSMAAMSATHGRSLNALPSDQMTKDSIVSGTNISSGCSKRFDKPCSKE